MGEAKGYRATIEKQILGGLGSVDVALEKDTRAIACEISVTSTVEYELDNIQKCLAAGFEQVILVSSERKTLNKAKERASASLKEEDFARVLFFTSQPPSAEPQGFLALAEFDKIANGGNRDGFIDNRDAIFQMLRLWLDSNHNGVSELAELYPLHSFHIASLGLSYKEKKRRDEHENWFRYRARVRDDRGTQVGRWAWDVFLVRLR